MANNILGNIISGLMSSNPNVKNNPKAMEAIQAIMTGDSVKGQEIAKEICRSNGANPQDAVNAANNWFASLTERG